MNITVASFNGTTYLEKPTPVLANSGEFYFALFVNPTSLTATIVEKVGCWSITTSAGIVTFSATGSDASTSTVSHGQVMTAGVWYFIEAYHTSAGVISVCVTPVSFPSLATFATPVTMSVSTLVTTGDLHLGNGFTGLAHTMLYANTILTTEEREFMFAAGAGRRYWELSTELKTKMASFWQLDATSGSRSDKSGLNILTVVGGAVGSSTRSVTPVPTFPDSETLQAAADLVSRSYAFQDWVGVGSAATALNHIYLEANEDDIASRPNALVMSDEARMSIDTGSFTSGTIMLQFEADADGGVDSEEAQIIFKNRVAKIVKEMQDDGTGLYVRSIDKTMPITLASSKEDTVYYGMSYKIEWGLE